LYYEVNGLIAVSDRPERLESLIAVGPVPATNGRIQLKDRLFGWIARLICEAVAPYYNAFSDNPVPERWARALVGHYLGIVILSPDALDRYRAGKPVNAISAGKGASERNVTPALDRIRHTLQGSPVKLASNQRHYHLLDAIARSVAAGLLQQGNADPRQVQRMLLNAPAEYLIERASR
jgi:hypothetical protein